MIVFMSILQFTNRGPIVTAYVILKYIAGVVTVTVRYIRVYWEFYYCT